MRNLFKSHMRLMLMALVALLVTNSFGLGYLIGTTRATASAAAAAPTPSISTDQDTPAEFEVFWEAWRFVESEFYGQVPTARERTYGAIRGMVNAYGDENTAFIDPERAAIFREDASGSFEGIGAVVRMGDSGYIYIFEVYPGRPAAEAGLQRGDIILEVDGKPLQGLSLYEAISLIRGKAGTEVVLTIFREGLSEPFKVSVRRARIEIEVARSKWLDEESGLGYVALSDFSRGASLKLANAVRELEKEHALRGLVFDLRNNPGGLLDEAVFVASQFIADGTVTIERGKGGVETVFEALPKGTAVKVPLVVLVNRGSASAAEIVAGAIKDRKRGQLVGEQTFGKGTVQIPHRLSDGSELRVTIAEWLTPNRKQINHEGIAPDIVVELTQADFRAGRDPQVERAIQYFETGK